MNNSAPVPSHFLEPSHLRDLLKHVDAEEISLHNVVRLLKDVPAMSQSADEAQRRDMRLRIEQSMQHAALLSQNRVRVTNALAQYLSIPAANVCFSALLPHASPDRCTVDRLRERATADACSTSERSGAIRVVDHQ
jgi:hypothetical protein